MMDGFARAQADYEAQMPPEPEEAEDWTLGAVFTFHLTLKDCTFSMDEDAAKREAQEYARSTEWQEGLMERVRAALNREFATHSDKVDWIEVDEVEVTR